MYFVNVAYVTNRDKNQHLLSHETMLSFLSVEINTIKSRRVKFCLIAKQNKSFFVFVPVT